MASCWTHTLLAVWLLSGFGIVFTGCSKEVVPARIEEPQPPDPPPPPAGPTIHSQSISGDEIWSPQGNPHIVNRMIWVGYVWGQDNSGGCARLTIRPGCEVRFAHGAGLATANYWGPPSSCGQIIAAGTADSVIVLTADSSVVEPGFWKGLSAGRSDPLASRPGKPGTTSPNAPFRRKSSSGKGIAEDGDLVLRWCRIVGAGEADGAAVRVGWIGSLTMSHTEIRSSAGKGVEFYGMEPSGPFEHNSITACADYPVELASGMALPIADCHLTGNASGKDAIHLIVAGGMPDDLVLVDAGVPYIIDEGRMMIVSGDDSRHSKQLTLQPGVTLSFGRGSGLVVGDPYPGTLVATGGERPITLTNAGSDPPSSGWIGLRIGPNAGDGTRLTNCRVLRAGADGRAGVVIEESRPFIAQCRIEECASPGILLLGGNVPNPDMLRRRNAFAGNTGSDVVWDPGPGGTLHLDDIVSRDEVWAPSGNPHRVRTLLRIRGGGPNAPQDAKTATLRILPGCVVWFEPGAGLTVDSFWDGAAKLEALGTAADPILFTGAGGVGNVGTWSGLSAGVHGTALLLEHCMIEGAGAGGKAAVLFHGGVLRMNDCEIRRSGGPGAIIIGSAEGLHRNRITECAGDALTVSPFAINGMIEGNQLTGNALGHDRIVLTGAGGSPPWPNGDLTLTNQGVPYVVIPGCFGSAGRGPGGGPACSRKRVPTLTIGPGCTILFQGGRLPIAFLSYHALVADGTDGEINFAGTGPEGGPGDWSGILFDSTSIDSLTRVVRCRIAHAGRESHGAIIIDNARPRIRDCLIEESASWGIYLEGDKYPNPDSLESWNRFAENDSGDVRRPGL